MVWCCVRCAVLCCADGRPVPVVEVDVDLDGLVGEACLEQSGLRLLLVTAEQQHVGQRRLLGGELLNEVYILHLINLNRTTHTHRNTTREKPVY